MQLVLTKLGPRVPSYRHESLRTFLLRLGVFDSRLRGGFSKWQLGVPREDRDNFQIKSQLEEGKGPGILLQTVDTSCFLLSGLGESDGTRAIKTNKLSLKKERKGCLKIAISKHFKWNNIIGCIVNMKLVKMSNCSQDKVMSASLRHT